jgi:hypothetical protein
LFGSSNANTAWIMQGWWICARVFLLGCMEPESTQKNFFATKRTKIQEFFWMKKPNVNHGL